MRRFFLLIFALVVAAQMSWGVNQAYYESLNGKSDAQLRQALTVLLYTKHTMFDRYNWDFPFDYDSEGYVWDIYTRDCQMRSDIGTGNTCCCDGVNREHVVCQSTFGQGASEDKIPQYSDRHHLFLTDAHTNSFRNNYAYGDCHTSADAYHGSCTNSSTHIPGEGTSTCEQHSLGWLGSVTTYADLYNSNQKVYEVDDEFKGDVARAILYMVVRYAEKTYCRLPDTAKYCTSTGGVTTQVNASLRTENNYPVTAWINDQTRDVVGQLFSESLTPNYGLSDYGKAILLKWHRQDPVSQKEKGRNDGVEAVQGNRNPFVDYPCLVEYLWGDKMAQAFSTSTEAGTFEPAPLDTVVWMANGSEVKRDTIVQYERVALPDEPAACSETQVFMGWTSTANYSSDDAPEDLFHTTKPLISQDSTFYAVYATAETTHYPAANSSVVMADYDTISGDFGIFHFEARKNNGINHPTYNKTNKDGRVYAKGSLIIRSVAPMTQIVFHLSAQGKQRLAAITADTCTIATQALGDTTVTWTGESTFVTFTVGDNAVYGSDGASKAGQLCFTSVDIASSAYSLVTYSSYCQACAFDPTDVKQVEAVSGVRKQLVNGQLLILRDGQLYDARGQRVK